MTAAVVAHPADRVLEVLVAGNLAVMTAPERLEYYDRVCSSLGLNPMTKPFEFLNLQGKTVLYATKACTDQLRRVHGVSISEPKVEYKEGLCVVSVSAVDATGRTDADIGAVAIEGLKGEARSNAIMKAITKSKRRVTLSICGLGMLDETEIDDIPDSAKRGPRPAVVMPQARIAPPNVDVSTGEIMDFDDEGAPIEAPTARESGGNTVPEPAAAPTLSQQPAMGLEDTGEPPATEEQLTAFWTDVSRMGFKNDQVHSFAGVATVKGLSNRQLTAIKRELAAVKRNEQAGVR